MHECQLPGFDIVLLHKKSPLGETEWSVYGALCTVSATSYKSINAFYKIKRFFYSYEEICCCLKWGIAKYEKITFNPKIYNYFCNV